MSTDIMSYQRNNFLEMDTMFLEFEDDLDNLAERSSSVGDNVVSSSQPPGTPTPRRLNGRISMRIATGAEKPISPHAVRFSQAIGWVDVGREYIKVVKGDLQMLTTFKEFRVDCHRHFKKYSDSEEARVNPPNDQSRTNKTVRQKLPYNHSSRSKSLLQRQHELVEKKKRRASRSCGVVSGNTRSSWDVRVIGRRGCAC
uniref:CACTA en-spm transposon protein n=1 Tax=Cucumis melo TaxID=3656 RepID=A0A9I9E5A0_CUCME